MNNIKLHEKSKEYLSTVFDGYEEEKVLTEETVVKNPIIHLYADSDTYDENGELRGYIDSLFFKVNVYDPVHRIKYTHERVHDSVDLLWLQAKEVKIFKDGSTLISAFGEYQFDFLTSLVPHKIPE